MKYYWALYATKFGVWYTVSDALIYFLIPQIHADLITVS